MSERRPHIIKPNHSSETPQAAIWFDTETNQKQLDKDTVQNILWFGYAVYKRRKDNGEWTKGDWIRFETKEEFYYWINSVTRAKTRTYVFCHNTNFDIPVMDVFHELPARGWKLTMAVIEGPPTILKFTLNSKSLQWLDTLNIWRLPLKDIGEMINLPKLPMPKESDSSEKWDKYGKRDVEIISEACIQWWDFITDHDLGGFAHTTAGQALRAYRHRFMQNKIYIDNNERALDLSRRAYLGGRCEAYFIGFIKAHVTLLDINSMYPKVMQDEKYPARLVGTTKHATVEDLKGWLVDSCLVVDVTLRTTKPAYPIKSNDRLIYPTGEFRTVLCTGELKIAIANNDIHKIHEVAVYTAEDLFSKYVNYFYNLRLKYKEAKDNARDGLTKNFLTNLYGKFGQTGLVYEPDEWIEDLTAKTWKELDLDTDTIIRWRQLGGLLQRRKEDGESRESHPAIAAHVTSYGRALLWKLQNLAGRENVIYSDTDSIYVVGKIREQLKPYIHKTELGKLKIEAESDYMDIKGAKDYMFGDTYKLKGARKNALWLNPNKFEQERWSGLKGMLNKNELDKQTITTVTKNLKREYLKGIIGVDGYVIPFNLK